MDDRSREAAPVAEPRVPEILHPLAAEILEALKGRPEAASIVIGGGVALQHYCGYRETVDLDAWWAQGSTEDEAGVLESTLRAVAERSRLELSVRQWRETRSFEFRLPGEAKKQFSFQIARRSIELQAPFESAWAPVKIETLDDNLGSKMNALVDRGAPRDLLDVFEVCRRGLASPERCWQLWSRKNPEAKIDEGKLRVLHHLEALGARRPLDSMPESPAREAAAAVRRWAKTALCRASGGEASGGAHGDRPDRLS